MRKAGRSFSLDRALACLDAAEPTGKPVMIGFNRRFDPNFAALKTAFDAGEIGKGELLSITSFDPAPPPVSYIKVSGGLFRDMMIHDFDMACWLFGAVPARVTAVGSSIVDPAIGAAGDVDTAVVTLSFADGRIAVIKNSRRAVYGYDQRIELLGSEGLLGRRTCWRTPSMKITAAGALSRQARIFLPRTLPARLRGRMDRLRRGGGGGRGDAGDAAGRGGRAGLRRGGDPVGADRRAGGDHAGDAGGGGLMRKLGCCTWIFGAAPLDEIAARAVRSGLDGVELHGDIDGIDPVAAAATFAAEGLEIFSITPGDADISHPDAAVRAAALAYYERLMDWAAALGGPLVGCHGLVARVRPIATQQAEDAALVAAVRTICGFAEARGLAVVYEILNRYESHQIRTVAEGLDLLAGVGAANLRLLADAYHMNIEEADPAAALRQAGAALGLYHAADSNRCGLGEGHVDFAAQITALDAIGYGGPVILEVAAPGPDPFTPDKGAGFRDIVEAQLATSVARLRALGA